jgi:hypothetical protein
VVYACGVCCLWEWKGDVGFEILHSNLYFLCTIAVWIGYFSLMALFKGIEHRKMEEGLI